ncbi:hypothetical protein VAA_04235 [Vibrio anguillarum 775]|nr:hypothetical protein VAA_04235 [Vibrio anguillarum 775]ARV28038.1 hypothetical protein A6A12_0957 [Vibrio anguillarum]
MKYAVSHTFSLHKKSAFLIKLRRDFSLWSKLENPLHRILRRILFEIIEITYPFTALSSHIYS